MWSDHDRSGDMRCPKYLYVVAISKTEALSIMAIMGDNGNLFGEVCITLHLASLAVPILDYIYITL